jgi:hypothetical protein
MYHICTVLRYRFISSKIPVLKKCVVLQVNDAAVGLRLVVFVSKVQGFYIYTDYSTDWMGEGREERGATPLTCCVG